MDLFEPCRTFKRLGNGRVNWIEFTVSEENNMAKKTEGEDGGDGTLSEGTKLRLSLALGIVAAVVSFTWWAKGVDSDLKTLVTGQKMAAEMNAGMIARIVVLERATDMFMQ